MKELKQYSDVELVQRIVAGEVALFELVIRRNNPSLYKIGRSYNYNHEDTQDLMQDTYINAFMNLSKFENRAILKTWIIKIMLNNCYRRRQKWGFKNITLTEITEQSQPLFSSRQTTDANQTIMNRELNLVIESALIRLPLAYRLVFSLREINGLSTTETAEALSISVANVKVRLSRAKKMLRKEIEKAYSPDEIFEFNLIYCDIIVDRVMRRIKEENLSDK